MRPTAPTVVVCWLAKSPEHRTILGDRAYAWTPEVSLGPLCVCFRVNGDRIPPRDPDTREGRGETASQAWADACFGGEEIRDLPLEALACWAPTGFEPQAKMIPLLRELGLQTLGDLLDLPESSVPLRFGKPAYQILEALRHPKRLPWSLWPTHRPATLLQERQILEPEQRIQELEPVLFVLKVLLDRMFLKLENLQQSLAELELRISLENRSVRILRARFPIAQTASPAVVAMLRDRLQVEFQKRPLEDYLSEIEVCALELAHGRSSQLDAFDRSARSLERWTSFLARTQDRLGTDQIYQVELVERYLPEKSFRYVPPRTAVESPNALPLPSRPLRWCDPPLVLEREGGVLRQGTTDRVYRIRSWSSPERLSGEWWWEEFERSYFRVQCVDHPDLWIFSEKGQLYLHGVFD